MTTDTLTVGELKDLISRSNACDNDKVVIVSRAGNKHYVGRVALKRIDGMGKCLMIHVKKEQK